MKKILSITLMNFLFLLSPLWAKPKPPITPIDQVTIYKDRANIQRSYIHQLTAGYHTITFKNLPFNLLKESLKVKVTNIQAVEVLGLQTKEIHILKNSNKEFMSLNQEQKSLKDKRSKLLQKAQYIYQQDINLNKISSHYQKSFIKNLNSKKWNPKNFKAFLSFLKQQDTSLFKLWSKYYNQYNQITKELQIINANISTLGQSAQKSYLDVNVNLNIKAQSKVTINLTYMVFNANWRPHYSFHIDSQKSVVTIEQNALITQSTGEDWDNCKIFLSNNHSNLKVKLPSIFPQKLNYKKVAAVKTKVQSTQIKNSNIATNQIVKNANNIEQEKINKIFTSKTLQTIKNNSLLIKIKLNKKSSSYTEGLEVIASKNNIVYRRGEIINPFQWALMSGQAQIFYNGEYIQNFHIPFIPSQKKFYINTGIVYDLFSDRYVKNKTGKYGKIAGLLGKKKIFYSHIKNVFTNKSSKKLDLRILEQVPISQIKEVEIEFDNKKSNFTSLPHFPSWYYRDISIAANKKMMIEFDIKITAPEEFAFNWN